MSAPVDLWAAQVQALHVNLAPLMSGFSVEVVPSLDSTNSELMRRSRAGSLTPVLLVALQQTAGRGRLGRQWHSAATSGEQTSALTFSVGLPLSPASWSGLSLAVGVAIAQALHPALRLKWPNDIWWQDRKVAGILIETASTASTAQRYVVVGVGINLEPVDAAGLSTAPAWLRELLPEIDARQALARVAEPLVHALQLFEARGFEPFAARFRQCDALAGVDLVLSDGRSGTAHGVDAHGALLVHTAQGLTKITSAEVSVRPLRPPDYNHL